MPQLTMISTKTPSESCGKSIKPPRFQALVPQGAIVDLAKPNQYGPRDFDGGKQPNSLHFRERWMTNDARDGDDRGRRPSEEAALSARLRHLGDRLDQQRASTPPENAQGTQPADDRSGMARGLRMSTELVAAVVVGGALGWGIDRVLGISPWAFIVLLLLGFVAGILNVMRAAGMVAERNWHGKQ